MAKNNNELKLAISLSSEIDQFLYGTSKKAKKEFSQMTKAATQTAVAIEMEFKEKEEKVESLFSKLGKAGDKAFKATAKAAMDAGKTIGKYSTMAAKEGIAFESAFDGVMKTTQASSAEYESMRNEILSMTREIPSASSEIAAIASAAGQLGIPKDDIMDFSKTMLELGSATNLSAASAAEQLTKLGRITGMSTDEYDRLGSVLVSLGNEFNTAESQITDMAVQLASSGNFAEYSEAQIMAVATSMAGLGIEAGAGGAAMGELTDKIKKAVESGSKDLQTYADTANMTAEEFKESFAGDQAGTVADFLSGFGNMEMDDQSSSAFLDGMGFSDKSIINTISNIASSGDLMSRALETSNLAWNDNIALTQEASERFDTTQGKLTIMKNSFSEMGIQIYDQFNSPLKEGIDIVTGFVNSATSEFAKTNVISELSGSLITKLPTLLRQLKDTGNAIYEFSKPLFEVGNWLVQNPTILLSTIAGIGMAITSYKVIDGIMGVAKAISVFNSSCLPMLAVTGAVAAIAAITTAIKSSANEAKKDNLDRHFGKLTLSMEELNDIAETIVKGNSIGKVEDILSAFGEVKNIEAGIDETVRSLSLMNWKVKVGIELNENEKDNYINNISDYIQQAQNFIQTQQYAVNISMELLTSGEMDNSNLITQINQFYAGKEEELKKIGKDLNNAVTDAFQDDLLTFDEVKIITELQQKMAKIQSELTDGYFEGGMNLLESNFIVDNLSSDSFMNLIEEQSKVIEKEIPGYDEAYKSSYIVNKAMYEDGKLTEGQLEEYNKYSLVTRNMKVGEMQSRALSFSAGSLTKKYSDEIAAVEKMFDDTLENFDNHPNLDMKLTPYVISGDIKSMIGKPARDALSGYWEIMKEDYYDLVAQKVEIEKQGLQAPDEMLKAIEKATYIGAAAGDENLMLEAMTIKARGNEQYKANISNMLAEGASLPDEISSVVEDKVLMTYADFTQKIEEMAADGIKVNVLKYIIDDSNTVLKKYFTNRVISVGIDALRANGGVVTKPEIAMIAEAGYPEVIVPIDGSQNAISLWQKAGEMLGIGEQKKGLSFYGNQLIHSAGSDANGSEEANKFTFSPVYQFNGEAPDRKILDDHVKSSFDQWEGMMNRWMKNNQRFSFS